MYINKLKSVLLYIAALLLVTSCNWFSKKDGEVDKSLLLYMAITSNLNSSISMNIDDIEHSPFVPEYFDYPKESGDVLLMMQHNEGKSPKLQRVYRDKYGVIQYEVLMEYEGRSSIDPAFMKEVLEYANTLFPARESGVLFSSHGTGWIPDGYYANPTKSALCGASYEDEIDPYAHLVKSFGQINKKEMDITDLAASITNKYDYIIFDACLMGGIEVAYELQSKCDYLLFSPMEIMAAGFPYSDIMEQVFHSEGEVVSRLSQLAKCYYDYYNSPGEDGGTITLVRTAELGGVASAVRNILDRDGASVSGMSVYGIQKYFRGSVRHWFYDFEQFMEKISTDSAQLDVFRRALERAVVVKYATAKFINVPISNYSGLSTYIPNVPDERLESYYSTLAWEKEIQILAR